MATKIKKEDYILMFYYTRYGLKGMGLITENEFAEGALGVTKSNLKKNTSNFRYLMGNESENSDIKKIQKEVYSEYKEMTEPEFLNVAQLLIKDKAEDIASYQKVQKEKRDKERFEEDAQKLADIFRKMGKDPNKMRKVEKLPDNAPAEAQTENA
jgi:hypothetical protein